MTSGEIKKRVLGALSPLEVPVGYQTYGGKGDPYFTFFVISDGYEAYGDGNPLSHGVHIQVDGWSKGNLDGVTDQARALLEAAGFRYEGGQDFYEPDTKMFHRAQDFYLYKEE